jgi:hypothetical protein
MIGTSSEWAMERATDFFFPTYRPNATRAIVKNQIQTHRLASVIDAARQDGYREAVEAAAQQLEDRAARFPIEPIFSGKIMREELTMHARKLRALLPAQPQQETNTMKVWAKTKEFSEGKFLVTRRDGTTPDWPHFVMGARDPAVPIALRAYALYARTCGFDEAYCDSVRELAEDFNTYRLRAGDGDPDAAPHRKDDPAVLGLMRHQLQVRDLLAALRAISTGESADQMRAIALAVLGDAEAHGGETKEC